MNTNFNLQIFSSTSITTLFTVGGNFASCRVAHLLELLPSAAADLLGNNLVTALFEDLAAPLERLVSQFPDREVRGRTATKILGHKDTRVMFDADVGREAKAVAPAPIAMKEGAERTVIELRKMLEAALKRAGAL